VVQVGCALGHGLGLGLGPREGVEARLGVGVRVGVVVVWWHDADLGRMLMNTRGNMPKSCTTIVFSLPHHGEVHVGAPTLPKTDLPKLKTRFQ
jgi:hypothetical protein